MEPQSNWDLEATWRTFEDGTFATGYHGLQLQKCEQDLQRYRAAAAVSGADLMIEAGTRYGASALWFQRELGMEVITIDVEPKLGPLVAGPGIESIRGSSISDWVFEILLKRVRGKRVMVSLDSDHHSPHVQAEIGRLGSLVSRGCYLVIEDTCFDLFDRAGHPDRARKGGARIPEYGGPLHALEVSMIESSRIWDRNTGIEQLSPVSHSPCGWWRRRD